MKKITITVSVDGNEVSREYAETPFVGYAIWGERIMDILDTIEKSNEPMK